jgi:hypothetical protein
VSAMPNSNAESRRSATKGWNGSTAMVLTVSVVDEAAGERDSGGLALYGAPPRTAANPTASRSRVAGGVVASGTREEMFYASPCARGGIKISEQGRDSLVDIP